MYEQAQAKLGQFLAVLTKNEGVLINFRFVALAQLFLARQFWTVWVEKLSKRPNLFFGPNLSVAPTWSRRPQLWSAGLHLRLLLHGRDQLRPAVEEEAKETGRLEIDTVLEEPKEDPGVLEVYAAMDEDASRPAPRPTHGRNLATPNSGRPTSISGSSFTAVFNSRRP